MIEQHIFQLSEDNRHVKVKNLTTLYRILRATPAKFGDDQVVFYFENFFNLLQKVILRDNWIEIVQEVIKEDWLNYGNPIVKVLLENIADYAFANIDENEPERPLSDLTFLMEQAQEPYELFLDNEGLNEWLQSVSREEIYSLSTKIQNEFGFKRIYLSNEISETNLLKQLKNIHNSLVELSIDLEGEDPLRMGMEGKYLAVGMSNESRYSQGVFFVDFDTDDNILKAFYDNLYQKVWSVEGGAFFDKFWEHIRNNNISHKVEKFRYLNLFAEHLQDCRDLLERLELNGPEYTFLDDIILSVEKILAQKETLELNRETAIAFFSNWKDGFIAKLNEFNVARVLSQNLGFRKELFNLACIFEYVVLYDYKFSFWKDINFLEKLVDYSFKVLSDKDLNNYEAFNFFIMQVMSERRVLDNFAVKTKDMTTKDLMHASFQSYVNYFRNHKSNYDMLKVPTIEEEVEIEKEFWENNLPELLELLAKP